jgi:hypothetical protein
MNKNGKSTYSATVHFNVEETRAASTEKMGNVVEGENFNLFKTSFSKTLSRPEVFNLGLF